MFLLRFNANNDFFVKTKQWGACQGRWPEKSADFVLQLLKNAESNAELKVIYISVFLIQIIKI